MGRGRAIKESFQRLIGKRGSWLTLLLWVGFSALVSAAMNLSGVEFPANFKAGSIAAYSIRADRDYEIVDEEATRKLQASGADSLETKDVIIKVQRGESIVRAGDRIEPWHVKVIAGIQRERSRTQLGTRWIGTFGFTLLLLGLLYPAGLGRKGRLRIGRRDLAFLGSILLAQLLLQRLLLFFLGGIRDLLPFDAPLSAFYFLIPVAAGPMLVRLVMFREAAFLFVLVTSALASLLLENSLLYLLYFISTGLAATWLAVPVRSRSGLLAAGLQLGLVNLLLLLVLNFAHSAFPSGITWMKDLPVLLPFAFAGGVMVAVMNLILLPVIESVFNYLTPIKLLELGSLNHPILREMIVRAPGTYHHSHLVGILAEAACEAIGADTLFARVASYFHDIGKMKKSPYFIENQREGEDRHAPLAPSMSALIIASHVKEGIELAREYKLPERIIDIIPQHQGTKLISYFYSKAKQAEQRDMHLIYE